MKINPSIQRLFLYTAVLAIVIIAIYNISTNSSKKTDLSRTNTNSTSTALIWGQDHDSQIGNAVLPENTVSIALGTDFSLALLSDGHVLSWGSNDAGQLGRPTTKENDATPTVIPNLSNIVAISATSKHTLALDKNGQVFAFGSNFTGQIGDGTNNNAKTPVLIDTPKAKKISAGYKFSMMIDEDNNVYVWGASCSTETQKKALALLNSFGSNMNSIQGGYYDSSSAGTGSYDQSEDCLNEDIVGIKSKTPKKLEGVSNVQEISAGYGHGLILMRDGDVWSFGCNSFGQLGRAQFDNAIPNAVPVKIEGIKNATAIAAGFRTSLILSTQGKAFYWGINAKIDPTTGSTFNLAIPEELPLSADLTSLKIKNISSGRDFSLVIADNGKAYGFGNDTYNIISKTNESYIGGPTVVDTLVGISPFTVVAGGMHAGALYQKK